MHYPLGQFEAIPKAAQQKLATFDVRTTDDLLIRAATPRLRERLAQETGVGASELTRWAGIADLVRIKGIGPAYAELLVGSGLVTNIQQFLHILEAEKPCGGDRTIKRIADREEVRLAAADLARQLRDFAQQHRVDGRAPGIRELAEAAEEAAELRPRLVLAASDDEGEFRQYIFTRYRQGWQHLLKFALATLGTVAAVVVLIFVGMLMWEHHRLNQLIMSGDVVDSISAQFARSAIYYGSLSLAILVVMALLITVALLAIYKVPTYVLDTTVLLWLFKTPPYQAFYRKITALDMERQKRASWWGFVIFLAVALGLFIHFSSTHFTSSGGLAVSESEFFSSFSLPVALGGVLLAVVICMPKLHFFLRELRVDPALDEGGAQHYLIYYLGEIALIPIMVVLLTQVALPRLLWTHAAIYRTYLEPRLTAHLLETRAEIANLTFQDESIGQHRDQMLHTFDEILMDHWLDYGLVISEEDTEVLDVAIPLALNIVVWLALAAVALLFVLPYLVLGGWRRGVFYMLVLAASFFLEDELQRAAPTWFSLRSRSVAALLIVAFAVFANALFFDWVFETSTERTKVCPGCQAQLDEYDMHCSVCGLVQP